LRILTAYPDGRPAVRMARQDSRPTVRIGRQDGRPAVRITRQDGRPTVRISRHDGRPRQDRPSRRQAYRQDAQADGAVPGVLKIPENC
jgi:uncharacterized membrane protein